MNYTFENYGTGISFYFSIANDGLQEPQMNINRILR